VQRLPAPIQHAAAPTVGAGRGLHRSHRGGGVSVVLVRDVTICGAHKEC